MLGMTKIEVTESQNSGDFMSKSGETESKYSEIESKCVINLTPKLYLGVFFKNEMIYFSKLSGCSALAQHWTDLN